MQLSLFEYENPRLVPPNHQREQVLDEQCVALADDAIPSTGPRSLAEALDAYDDAVSDHPHRIQIRTSIRMAGRALGLPLDQIPTDPLHLRPLLESACPARAGVKPRSWITAKSKVVCCLKDLGTGVVQSRSEAPLSPAWQSLVDGLDDRSSQIRLSRLLRHFTAQDVEPADVTPRTFEAYKLELTTKSLKSGAERSYSQALRQWNIVVAMSPDWPQVPMTVPRNARWYSLEWSAFPDTFQEDVEGFLDNKCLASVFDDNFRKPVSSATTETRRKIIRNLASALVLSGKVTAEQVTGLAVLTRETNVRAAVQYIINERSAKQAKARNVYQVGLLRVIARDWVCDAEATAALTRMLRSITTAAGDSLQKGITEKNKDRLRQFDIPGNIDLLVGLPHRVLRAANGKSRTTQTESVRVMYALQTAILTFVPIRLKNLTGLTIGGHLIDRGRGSKRVVRIYLPGAVTKTKRDYEAPLPRFLYPVLDSWLTVYRARICNATSPYLFPNSSGAHRSQDALSFHLKRFWAREMGMQLNPHLFRHIAAKILLDRDPTGIEIVRQLLGHTSQRTTLNAYAELQTNPAFKRFEDALLTIGDELPIKKVKVRGKATLR